MDVVSLGTATATNGEKLLQRYVIEPKASLITCAAAIAILARNASAINSVSGLLQMFSYVPLSV